MSYVIIIKAGTIIAKTKPFWDARKNCNLPNDGIIKITLPITFSDFTLSLSSRWLLSPLTVNSKPFDLSTFNILWVIGVSPK